MMKKDTRFHLLSLGLTSIVLSVFVALVLALGMMPALAYADLGSPALSLGGSNTRDSNNLDVGNNDISSQSFYAQCLPSTEWYDGKVFKPGVELSYYYPEGDTPPLSLTIDTDYVISGYEVINNESNQWETVSDPKDVGRYRVVLEGIGNYTGQTYAYFYIRDEKNIENWLCTVWDDPSLRSMRLVSTGSPLTPTINVATYDSSGSFVYLDKKYYEIVGYTRFNSSIDKYESVSQIVDPGEYQVLIEGIHPYHGTVAAPFTVYDSKHIAIFDSWRSQSEYAWTGSPIDPIISLTREDSAGNILLTLTQDKDYRIVSYARYNPYTRRYEAVDNATDPGSYDVQLEGMGDYHGSTSFYFTVYDPNDITSQLYIAYTLPSSKWYDGEVFEPEAVLSGRFQGPLALDIDYQITGYEQYNDETKEWEAASDPKDIGAYRAVLEGRGDYYGTTYAYFHIYDEKDFSAWNANAETLYYTGEPLTPSIEVYCWDENGERVVLEGQHYEIVRYDRINIGVPNEPVDSAVEPGRYLVTLEGVPPYYGIKNIVIQINPADIADSSATIADQTYDGKAKTPDPVVKQNGTTLINGVDYAVAYKNNVNVGTATATITGKGNYTGTKTVNFKINAASTPTPTPTPITPPTPAPGSDPNQLGEGGSAIGAGASAAAAEAAITKSTSEEGPAGSKFATLQLKSVKQAKASVTLSWTKVKGAKSYVVYGNACGKKNKMVKLGTASTNKYAAKKIKGKKLKKGTYYKFMVVALDANKNVVSASKVVHVATSGGKKGNYSKVTTKAKKNKVTIKKSKTFKLGAKQVQASKKLKVAKHRGLKYESSNTKIATVSSKGVIKGKKKGSCYVYAYTQSGTFAKIKVTVK